MSFLVKVFFLLYVYNVQQVCLYMHVERKMHQRIYMWHVIRHGGSSIVGPWQGHYSFFDPRTFIYSMCNASQILTLNRPAAAAAADQGMLQLRTSQIVQIKACCSWRGCSHEEKQAKRDMPATSPAVAGRHTCPQEMRAQRFSLNTLRFPSTPLGLALNFPGCCCSNFSCNACSS